ncbi:neuropathy target esterase sws isoform X3 [Sitophilus oryzae]|uniref:Neuropathy target esterase sws n=1 Tax=Sitophilus oryzae TaxID=7048 RepID=A0A6J2XWS9_SITOR|nr:neuropathy target esterase sws isoform X3 [Sitophilus oryzae]
MVYLIIYFFVLIVLSLITGLVVICIRRCHQKVFSSQAAIKSDGPRFRKRDKALFYGRKMIRKVKNISGQVRNSGQGKKRKLVMKFARRLLQMKKEEQEQLKVLEPPAEYLQEESLNDDRMPPDVLYMLQSIRVFGHFEKPVFLKLCKHTEIINVSAGSHLFKIGDPDENFYIVQSGKLNVFINTSDGTTSLKIVKPGESVTSLLSFTDVLTGHLSPYKTISAKAIEDSTVVKLPMTAFQDIFQEYPETVFRVIQVIMVRLQRVTFTALHHYLGLSAELIKQSPKQKGQLFFSPVKRREKDGTIPTSGDSSTTQTATIAQSQGHRRSKSSQDSKTISPVSYTNTNAPDMLADLDGPMANVIDTTKKRHSVPDDASEEELKKIAEEAFIIELGLSQNDHVDIQVEIREVSAGTYLMKEDSNKDVALVYIISGALTVTQKLAETESEVYMFTSYPGEIVGGLAMLTGEPSFFTIRAKHLTRIALLSKTIFYSIIKENPKVVLYVANMVVRRLSPFVRQVDFALDWLFIESGRAVYRQDDESECTYIVLSGRLRSVINYKDGKKELVGEYGKGDLVGVVEMVTQTKRSTTVIAVRDSELAKLPEGLFNVIKLKFPIVVTRLINLLGHRILGSWQKSTGRSRGSAVDSRPSQINFSTVAIIAVSDDVPLTGFTYELYHCLTAIGSTTRLTSDVIKKTLGGTIMDPNNEYRLSSWLAQQEDQHKISLYQCDLTVSAWTKRCIRQADCILIVGLGDNPPSLGKVEKELERLAIRTQKELVLLHKEGGKPQNTIGWLNIRSWVSSHHHILCPNRVFARKSQYRINELYSKVCATDPNVHSDFSRLARWLTGKSVGLVLGGGGARGSSHIGMIKAIQEAGIPIDMIGGVSIGALMGSLWCQERNITIVIQKAREWSKKMTQWWRQILDLTYPVTSMFSGKDFNKTIRGTLGETYIEDLWIPFFTITTDITASCMRIHTHGSLWRYVRASMSLSGYMPPLCDPHDGHLLLDGGYINNLPDLSIPRLYYLLAFDRDLFLTHLKGGVGFNTVSFSPYTVVLTVRGKGDQELHQIPGSLWRYVRASMSVVGIFPPLCDPSDGHMLVDGCYINNVPADVMRSMGADHILAIDVGSVDDQDLTNYGDDLSGWWLLWKRFNPFSSPIKVPNLPDIQTRLAYVSCVRQLEEVKNSDYCEYIRPPIDKYKTLQFGSFDEIREVGYLHGKAYFEGQSRAGNLPRFNNSEMHKSQMGEDNQSSQYTFTDLAQMVCKVSRPYEEETASSSSSESDDEDEGRGGYASEPTGGFSNETNHKGMRRAGGSLSLSENELEPDMDFKIKSPSDFT